MCYPSINTWNNHEALYLVEGLGFHREISQTHPVQMLKPPEAATIDAKKLRLINQMCVIK